MFIDTNTSREDLIKTWNENVAELVDAFIEADVDPDLPETTTEAIREVIISWIEAGDECAPCA